jgi:hypothetical protein
MPNKILIPREEAFDLIWGETLSEKKVGSRRWANEVEVVVAYNKKYYKILTYETTGDGEVDTFNYDGGYGNKEPVEAIEVKAVEVTTIDYVEV